MTVMTRYAQVDAYQTKDGSTIRELLHPDHHGNANQSLAEATVAVGAVTKLHRHGLTEEIYHITRGRGLLTLDGESIEVHTGDSVCIPPGTAHRIRNVASEPLVLLCCCSPAYSHGDTELLE